MRRIAWTLLLVLASMAGAHRLDEYLQLTALSVEKHRVGVTIYLTPGVAVAKQVVALIDENGDGTLSEREWQAYAARVGHDLTLSVDGAPRSLRLRACRFPPVAEMRKGTGEIRLDFDAPVSGGLGRHTLAFENRHQSRIAAYLVECLAPNDPAIQVVAQRRSPEQARYGLEYVEARPLPGARTSVRFRTPDFSPASAP